MAELPVYTDVKYFFLGVDLVMAREKLGLSQEELAAKCGWSQQNQQQLELPGITHHLSEAKRDKLEQAGIVLIETSTAQPR